MQDCMVDLLRQRATSEKKNVWRLQFFASNFRNTDDLTSPSNLEEKDNPSILDDDFLSRTD